MKHFTLLAFALLFFLPNKTFASHTAGGDITYECIGQDSFLVTLHLFRDCAGIQLGATQTMTYEDPCNGNFGNFTANLVSTIDVSGVCLSELGNTTCFGGNLPGMEMNTYQGIVVLPGSCNSHVLSWSLCCRASSVNVPASNGNNLYLESHVNTQDAPCNNSPEFTHNTIPYFCVGTNYNFNYGVAEFDGDSLVFSLVPALNNATQQLTYLNPYTGAVPIQGMTIDPNTGTMNFTPTTIGSFIVVVKVDEYRNGVWIGSIYRDIFFVVVNCAGVNDVPTSTGMTNFTGTANLIDSATVEMCTGGSFCFDVVISDPDAGDSLYVTTTLQQTFPGATFSFSGVNPVTVNICYSGNEPAGNYTFCVAAYDDVCPIPGFQYFFFNVRILDGTNAGPDTHICGNEAANLQAVGGTIFNWTSISGDPIIVGTNFSCNPCANPVATPTQATTYVVTSNMGGGCPAVDTVTVTVSPGFTMSVTQSDTIMCPGDSIFFDVITVPGAGSYAYLWEPSAGLSSPTVSNPFAAGLPSGYHGYSVLVTDSSGCTQRDSVFFDASDLSVSVSASATTVCPGDNVVLTGNIISGSGQINTYWQPDTVVGVPTASTTIATVNQTTDFWWTATDVATGCQDSANVIVIASGPPMPLIVGPSTALVGSSSTFTVSNVSGVTYFWTVTGGNITNGQSTNSIDVDWTTDGIQTVTVIVFDAQNCSNTSSVDVDVQLNIGMEDVAEEITSLHPTILVDQATLYLATSFRDGFNVQLYDLGGKLLRTERGNGHQFIIRKAGLSPGIYLLEVVSGEKAWKTKLLVR